MPTKKEQAKAEEAIFKAGKKVLVVDWFAQDRLSDVMDEKITDEEYQYILDNYTAYEDIRDSVINDVEELLREIRASKKSKAKE